MRTRANILNLAFVSQVLQCTICHTCKCVQIAPFHKSLFFVAKVGMTVDRGNSYGSCPTIANQETQQQGEPADNQAVPSNVEGGTHHPGT